MDYLLSDSESRFRQKLRPARFGEKKGVFGGKKICFA